MHLGGWTRLWIVLTLVYGAIVVLVAYQTRPRLDDVGENWIRDASNVIAETISRVEKTNLSSDEVRKGMFADKDTSEAIAWLEKVAVSPSEEQRIFTSAIATLNEKHRGIIEGFPALRREHILLAVAWWLGPAIALYVLGWSIGWIALGFAAGRSNLTRAGADGAGSVACAPRLSSGRYSERCFQRSGR